MPLPYLKLHKYLKNQKTDGFLVTKKENIFWLTEFWGSFGIFIQTKENEKFLITDSRYFERAQRLGEKNDFTPVLITNDNEKEIEKMFKFQTFFMENSISLRKKEWCQKIFPSINFLAQDSILEDLRAQKTEAEITKIKKAQTQVDSILIPFFKTNLKKDITEKALAFQLETTLRDHGNFELSFPIIVAFGKNSAIPHHEPSAQKLQDGDNILIDCGLKFKHFCSDITRNFVFGTPNPEYIKRYEQLRKVQEKTLQQFTVGKKISAIEQFCRDELGDQAPFFTHSLGHGVGLEIHENPRITSKSKSVLAKNHVATCEPGLYFPEKFGIRIEDLLVVREKKPEILSQSSKDLLRISEEASVKKLC